MGEGEGGTEIGILRGRSEVTTKAVIARKGRSSGA
jgi:hypothetical protein